VKTAEMSGFFSVLTNKHFCKLLSVQEWSMNKTKLKCAPVCAEQLTLSAHENSVSNF
jgi:hypothetical protein